MFGTTIQAIAAAGQTEALENAAMLLAKSGIDAGVCRFLPTGVAQWSIDVLVKELPLVGALLVRTGIEMTLGGRAVFAMLCQYALHAERLPQAIAVRRVSITLEVHPAQVSSMFDNRAMCLPLSA